MFRSYSKLLVGGLFGCLFMFHGMLQAASGCNTGQLFGTYNVEVGSIGFQGAITLPPTTTTAAVIGFANNPNSLSGKIAGLGRYYFDGTGNIIGVTAASSTSPAVTLNVGTFSVNTDCSASVKFTSGAAYDLYLANNGQQAVYVRTDPLGGSEFGILRGAGSCVNLNGSYTFQVGGVSTQSPTSGPTGAYAYSAAGTLALDGIGNFNLAQSLVTSAGPQKSTASGTYTVGGDCSVTLKFNSTGNSSFVIPASFKILMIDSSTGMVAVQPDSTNTLTGTLTGQ
jgi:hypothetical protein